MTLPLPLADPLPPRLLSLREACRRIGVCDRTLRAWIAAGRIAVVRLSRRAVRIEEGELARFVTAHREEARS